MEKSLRLSVALLVSLLCFASVVSIGNCATVSYVPANLLNWTTGSDPYYWSAEYSNTTTMDVKLDFSGLVLNATTNAGYVTVAFWDQPNGETGIYGGYISFLKTATAWQFRCYTVTNDVESLIYDFVTLNVSDFASSSYVVKLQSMKMTVTENGTVVSPYPVELPTGSFSGINELNIKGLSWAWSSGVLKVTHGATATTVIWEYIPVILVISVLGGAIGVLTKSTRR